MTDRPPRPEVAPPPSGPPANPFRLDLETMQARAEAVHRELLTGQPEACAKLRTCRPEAAGPVASPDPDVARNIVARECGLPDWPRLLAHIRALDRAREAVANGAPAPDAAMPTLHVRCGGDLRHLLRDAGFGGASLEYIDPLCQGPLGPDAGWIARRAAFLHEAYGSPLGRGLEDITAGLRRLEADLDRARDRYPRVVLWFEHDSYDQLILARLLARFRQNPPARLEAVFVNRYPGTVRFLGLGQLPPEALRLLWEARRPVSEAQLRTGSRVWNLLRSPNPLRLARAAAGDMAALPDMARALRRHCQELPWRDDGLSLTQRLVLQALAEGPRTIGELFAALTAKREPLPWLGDAMLSRIVADMGRADRPVFTASAAPDGLDWRNARLTLTKCGRDLLGGTVDWLSLGPPPRWVGGVRIPGAGACWRWEEASGMPVWA